MRSASNTASPSVFTIDEALLARVAWVAVGSVLLAAMLFSSGYLLVAVGVGLASAFGVASYYENETKRDFRVPLNDAWISAIDALADNGFAYEEPTRRGVTEGHIEAGDARVIVEQHPGGVSRVRVRVGRFALPDNRRRAALVLERVVAYLDGREITADVRV